MSFTRIRNRVMKTMVGLSTVVLPAHTIDCDWEDGEFEFDLPSFHHDHDDCWDCYDDDSFWFEYDCWGWDC